MDEKPIPLTGERVTASGFESPVDDDLRAGPFTGTLVAEWQPAVSAFLYTVGPEIVDPATAVAAAD